MKVSIVTISFNQVQFLEQAIRSVVEQDYPDMEYIVVDPGSTDGSREIIEKYRDRVDKIIFEPDNGPADGLNKGFAQASGDIFGFINADDFLLPGAIRVIAAAFENMPEKDVISGHTIIVNEDGRMVRKLFSRRFSVRRYIYGASCLAQQSTFFRSRAFKRTGGFNRNNPVAWDGELWVDLALTGAVFGRINKFIAAFRMYPQSITGSARLRLAYCRYREEIFRKVKGRGMRAIDRPIGWLMKVAEYGQHPRLALERLISGSATPSGYRMR